MVDDLKRDTDLGARRGRELETLKPGAPLADEQARAGRVAVMVELRVDPLKLRGALLDERPPQADRRAQLEDVGGRDPGLRHPPLLE